MRRERWFQDTERVLRRFWESKERLSVLRAKEHAILASIKVVEMELAEVKGIPKLTAAYGETFGGGQDDPGLASLIVGYEEQTQKLQKLLLGKYKQLRRIRSRMEGIEAQQAVVACVARRLDTRSQRVLEQRYVFNRSNRAIARDLHYSEMTIRRIVKHSVTEVAGVLGKK